MYSNSSKQQLGSSRVLCFTCLVNTKKNNEKCIYPAEARRINVYKDKGSSIAALRYAHCYITYCNLIVQSGSIGLGLGEEKNIERKKVM